MSEMHGMSEEEAAMFERDDEMGPMDVQVLLSWFFESADPHDIAVEFPEAA